jgi:hypothetical protein
MSGVCHYCLMARRLRIRVISMIKGHILDTDGYFLFLFSVNVCVGATLHGLLFRVERTGEDYYSLPYC